MPSVIRGSDGFDTGKVGEHKNRIINGNFDIWQRGTTQTTNGYGSADRWGANHQGTTNTVTQELFTLGQTVVPNNPKYYYRAVVTSVVGANNYSLAGHRIEGVESLSGKTVTLSFWAKANAVKNMAATFWQSFGTGGSPSTDNVGNVGNYALTTAWQKFTTTFVVPSVSGKTLGTDGNDFLRIAFWFDAGSIFNARTNTLGHQSGTFDIAQVQLEEGSTATDFEYRPIGEELALCQRYFHAIGTGVSKPTTSGFTHMVTDVAYDLSHMRTGLPTAAQTNRENTGNALIKVNQGDVNISNYNLASAGYDYFTLELDDEL